MHDVYAYGVVAPSMLIELVDDYPGPGGYAEVAQVHPSLGGEAAGSAYVLARLGVTTKLAGNRLADDAEAARVLALLSSVGVDCSAIVRAADVPGVAEVVISGADQRTVFGTYRRLGELRAWSPPSIDDVRSSRVVCLDPFFGDESHAVARCCLDAGIEYVTVDVEPESEIAHHASVIIVSAEFARNALPTSDPDEVWRSYTRDGSGLVIVTEGGDRLVYGRRDAGPREYQPDAVEVRDTTGAGDSFRAGIIYGMLRGLSDEELVSTASAVAAIVCARAPGVLNGPTEEELAAYWARRER